MACGEVGERDKDLGVQVVPQSKEIWGGMMDLQRGLVGLFAALLAGGVLAADLPSFANNGYDNSLSTYQHPCAQHYQGTTYVAYQGPHEDPYVCAYDHAAGTWQGPVRAGVSELGRPHDAAQTGVADNHGRPALFVDRAGYIHLVFGGHGGWESLGENRLGTPGSGRQSHVVSKRPQDISEWEVLDNIDPFGTYSQFIEMEDGDVYLFYRHGSHRSDWVYQKSTDNCRTFAPAVSVLKHKAQAADPVTHDAWYAWFTEGAGDSIVVTYVYHPCKSVDHTKQRVNLYFMRMQCGDESWENIRGESLELPVIKEYADRTTLVLDTGDTRCKRLTCAVDPEGGAHIIFSLGGQVCYTRWLGDAWQTPVTVADAAGLGAKDGDIIADSPTDVRLLLSSPGGAGGTALQWWKTADGGLTWARDALVAETETGGFRLGALVYRADPAAQVVFEGRDPAAAHLYRRLFMWGDQGFVGRPAAETATLDAALDDLIRALPNEPVQVKRDRAAAGDDD